jgi:hypothetical protein
MYYVLEGHETRQVDPETWAVALSKTDRHVADEMVGDVRISTVFLGIDHNFGGGIPLLFETMVFGGELDQSQDRYSTWNEAEAGHKVWVDRVKQAELFSEVVPCGFVD